MAMAGTDGSVEPFYCYSHLPSLAVAWVSCPAVSVSPAPTQLHGADTSAPVCCLSSAPKQPCCSCIAGDSTAPSSVQALSALLPGWMWLLDRNHLCRWEPPLPGSQRLPAHHLRVLQRKSTELWASGQLLSLLPWQQILGACSPALSALPTPSPWRRHRERRDLERAPLEHTALLSAAWAGPSCCRQMEVTLQPFLGTCTHSPESTGSSGGFFGFFLFIWVWFGFFLKSSYCAVVGEGQVA